MKLATIEELNELSQVLAKSERLGGFYINRHSGETFMEQLVNEIADVIITLIGLINAFGIRVSVVAAIKEVCKRYEEEWFSV